MLNLITIATAIAMIGMMMTVLRILDYPDPRLKKVADKVDDVNAPEVQQMISDMLETLENTPQCGGLAATQLDIAEPKQIFVFYDFDADEPEKGQKATAVINPEIIATEGEVFEPEGCMSVYPDHVHAPVKRPAKTHMRALDPQGNEVEYIRTGYLAKNFMHETEHLNGKLYIDLLKPLKRSMVEKKIKKAKKLQQEKS